MSDNAKWKDFVVKAEAARKANEAHEKSKDAMRETFRKALKLADETEIEFTKNGDRVTITQILERKKSARESTQDLSELF